MREVALAATIFFSAPVPALTQTQVETAQTVMPDLFASKSEPIMSDPSQVYRGKFFRASQLGFQRCILHRESRGHWFSTNRSDGYFGGFQMTPALARGVTWMMLPELQATYGKAIGAVIAKKLRKTEMQHWLPVFQQQAFSTILNWGGDWKGVHHWGGKARCAS